MVSYQELLKVLEYIFKWYGADIGQSILLHRVFWSISVDHV